MGSGAIEKATRKASYGKLSAGSTVDVERPIRGCSPEPGWDGSKDESHPLVIMHTDSADRLSSSMSVPALALHFFMLHWEKLIVLLVVLGLCLFTVHKGFSAFGDVLDWFQRQNNAIGWLCFTAVYCANVSLFLPGVVFVLGAGFVFKFWRGLAAVWIGGSFGQAFAFLLGRYLLRDCIVTLGRGKWRKWEVIDKAIELDGWKLVLLLRLSPLVPYNLLNVTMAMTRIDFWQFVAVSSAAIVPECAVMCYFGSLAKNVRDVVSGQAGPSGISTWALGGLSAGFCILAAGWATVVARRAIKRAELIIRSSSAALGCDPEEDPETLYSGESWGGAGGHAQEGNVQRRHPGGGAHGAAASSRPPSAGSSIPPSNAASPSPFKAAAKEKE